MKILITLLAPLFTALYVSAHGRIRSTVTVAGGNVSIFDDNTHIRRSNSQDPIYDFKTKDLTCGGGVRKPAPNAVSVKPGETVFVQWRQLDGGAWPHNAGPILTYLAKCDGDCTQFNQTKARFFKIAQQGKKSSGSWFQEDLYNGKNNSAFKIPRNLAPGQYLARHEIIALHLLPNGKAEFYPGCIQIKVGGKGNGRPSAGYKLLKFPGDYKDSDKGLHGNPFDKADYEFPGGPIARLDEGGPRKPSTSNLTASPTRKSSSTRKPSSSRSSGQSGNINLQSPSTPSGVCRLRPKSRFIPLPSENDPAEASSPTPTTTTTNDYKPRYLRIMRRIAGLH